MNPGIRIAACHVSPVFLSARQTTEKAVSLIQEAGRNKANLVVFPETYIPAFPVWSALRPPTENHNLFKRMALESVYVDGPEISAVRAAAKGCGLMVSLGISEKARYSSGALFNSNIFIDEDGEVLVHHRKLVPTFFERLTWGAGDGHGLRVADTRHGRIGGLICGENTNPLARYALMAQGEQVHISTWPAVWPTRISNSAQAVATTPVSNAAKEGGGVSATTPALTSVKPRANYDNVAANRIRAAAHCFEAKCFGVMCSGFLDDAAIETISSGSRDEDAIAEVLRQSSRGATMFLDPTGTPLTGFTSEGVAESLQNHEGILYAELNLGDCIEGKQYHEVVGGYQRLDVFELRIDRRRREPASFFDGDVQVQTTASGFEKPQSRGP